MTRLMTRTEVGGLEGPLAEKEFPDAMGVRGFTISLWIKVGKQKHFDPKHHPRIAREAAEHALTLPVVPNPTLVPLDDEQDPQVYALITFHGRRLTS